MLYKEMTAEIPSALTNAEDIQGVRVQYPKRHAVHHSLYLNY
jgi:hypothetical protein